MICIIEVDRIIAQTQVGTEYVIRQRTLMNRPLRFRDE